MFQRVALPTPFQVGPVNAYLAGRTIVDPGPDSEAAWSRLLDALDERGLEPAAVEQVLITHPHPDHFGLAHRLADAGATIVASDDATPILEAFSDRLAAEQAYFADFFERCGMARETATTVTELPSAFLNYASSVTVDRSVTAGDEVTVDGRTVAVGTLAGHAVGELSFAVETPAGRVALVGDNVLAEITPNPFLQPPPAGTDERPRVLPQYNESLSSLRQQPFDRFLPGHRGAIDQPSERIDAILDEHDERSHEVAEIVDGPTTPVDVMTALFGDLPVTEQFAGMSEAVGHLDVLERDERVTCERSGGVLVYRPA